MNAQPLPPSAAVTSSPIHNEAAAQFLSRLEADLQSGPLNLPCFPDIVPRVRATLDDPNSTFNDLVRVTSTEPRLAARLLQTANSAIFNPSGKPLHDLRSAVARLGHQAVQSIVTVFAIQQMKAAPMLKPVLGELTALWERSIAVASICQTLAKHLRVPADKVFLTGLLHGIGHFYLLVRSVEASSEMRYTDLPQELITEWQPKLGRAVLKAWGMETIVCDAVGQQRDYARTSTRAADITDVLIASIALAECLFDFHGEIIRCGDITAFARIKMNEDQLKAVLTHTEHSLDALRAALS